MLGKHVCGERDVVLPNDPAVDEDQSDFSAYRDALWDVSRLVIREGHEPTRFRITPLTVAQKRRLSSFDRDSAEWQEWIVRCGLVSVQGYAVETDDGPVEFVQPDRQDRPGMGLCASAEWIERDQLTAPVADFIAAMIVHISEAGPLSSTPSATPAGDGAK